MGEKASNNLITEAPSPLQILAVMPAYQAPGGIGAVVRGLTVPVLIVDDGSDPAHRAVIAGAGAGHVLTLPRNRGKGYALRAGFAHALAHGYRAVLTIDADGQHDPAAAPVLIAAWRRGEGEIIIGTRLHHAGRMPWLRRQTNRLMTGLLSRLAGTELFDSQSGYRVIDARVLTALTLEYDRFEAESELLIKAARAGFRIAAVPIPVIYRPGNPSHIRPLRDALRWLRFLARLAR